METDDNVSANAHLKQLLLDQIMIQGKGNILFKKILRRISIIYFSLSAVILIGIMFIIYIVSKPDSRANIAIKQMDALNTRISVQRQFIEIDRQDLEKTRKEVDKLIKVQDSLKK